RITGVEVEEHGARRQVTADYYLSALPVEVVVGLVTEEMKRAEPALAGLKNLKTAWMNGIQFYLAKDVPLVHGHTLYIDSAWCLTSISQQQFWPRKVTGYGNGKVNGILSVDVSDWENPNAEGKRAIDCQTQEEIKEEVWRQLKDHLNDQGQQYLKD